jgi:exodeoxyribonuclease VII small subunit
MSEDLDKMTFEDAFDELEATVQRLDADTGELTLEEAIGLYERGMRLARHCNSVLDDAELQVQQVTAIGDQQQLGMLFEE